MMKRRSLFLVGLILSAVSSNCGLAQTKDLTLQVFITKTFLSDDLLKSKFFLDELNILDSQRDELVKVLNSYQAKFVQVANDAQNASEKKEEVASECLEKLQEILLPHQEKDFFKAGFQRSVLKQRRWEAFLLWNDPLIQNTLDGKKGEFNNAAKKIVSDYQHAVSRHQKDVTEKIISLCPPKRLAQLNTIARLESVPIGLLGNALNPSTNAVSSWKQNDYAAYELQVKTTYVSAIAHNQQIQKEFEVTPDQVGQIDALLLNPPFKTPDEDFEKEKEEEAKLMAKGDLEQIEARRRKFRNLMANTTYKNTKQILNDILLPFQAEIINEYAKCRRMGLENSTPKGLGLLVSFIESLPEMQNPEGKKTVRKMEELLAEVESDRQKKFDKCCNDILSAMPERSRSTFMNMYGDCYDIIAERNYSSKNIRNR